MSHHIKWDEIIAWITNTWIPSALMAVLLVGIAATAICISKRRKK